MADHGDIKEINLDDDVWRTRLTAEEFRVLRDEGTERIAFVQI